MKTFPAYLTETLVTFPKKTGQAVFLAGGSRSGKSTFVNSFLGLQNFAVFDPDNFKKEFVNLSRHSDSPVYTGLRNLNFKNPDDVAQAHNWLKARGLKDKILKNLLRPELHPERQNVVFDITLKDFNDYKEIMPLLHNAGYKPTDIHIIWVLSSLETALARNEAQKTLPGGRVVPRNIVVTSHEKVAELMMDTIFRGKTFPGMDGKFVIAATGLELSVPVVTNNGKTLNHYTVPELKYFTLKEVGQPIKNRNWFNNAVWKTIEPFVPNSVKQQNA